MIDLHTHTLLSDGELLPFELVRRAEAMGYRAIAITDHVDSSNVDFAVSRTVRAVEELRKYTGITVIAGAEVTHAPPALIRKLVREARKLGARIIVVHGETLAEPVAPGTNRAAIEAGADIISHPGLISEEDVILAAKKGVALEITARKAHCISNGHVARSAMKLKAPLVINTDTHGPGDLISKETAIKILLGAGVEERYLGDIFRTSEEIVKKAARRRNA